ncbi:MAG TPA: peptide-methionine (S)-S-oxide reductase MsrA [Candidatus Nanoarchaeia archaeon]|nr:peptide-methionine (S)-S-oxide reductase MsrA [Candidatus Nanoarchaeia archaeon]
MQTATFALGCFWGPDDYFSKLKGVSKTRVGYMGGKKKNPSYYDLGDHTETIEITFNPKIISFEELLKHFWKEHDPTRQEVTQYKSAIFYQNLEQFKLAEKSKKEMEKKLGKEIITDIEKAGIFYQAEEYHQKYLQKGKGRVC